MASSLLVSRLANEISSILICKRLWRGRSYYSQQHWQQHVWLRGPRLGLEASQDRILRARVEASAAAGGKAAASGDCSGTSPSVSFGLSPGLGLSAPGGPRLYAKRCPCLTQQPGPLPLPALCLAPPPRFRSSARLRTSLAQTRGASIAQIPGKLWSLRRWN